MGKDPTLPGLTDERLRVLCFVGTRPEAVKLVPLVLAARARDDVEFRFVSSGQHPHQMLEVLDHFDTPPDADLELFTDGQTLVDVHERSLRGFSAEISRWAPHVVLVQGDTTSAMTGAMAAFYAGVPVGHIEAGLRTDNLANPFPEEMNRRVIDSFAQFLFPPTEAAARHLESERQRGAEIFVTGNTVVDTLRIVAGDENPLEGGTRLVKAFRTSEGYSGRVLVTVHRRESWGSGLDAVAEAVSRAAYHRPDLLFLVPLHPNPIVRNSFMTDLPRNVVLGEPLPYANFVKVMVGSDVVMTDSGGVLEEATSIGKQVVILRTTTERPEALESPNVRMVGTNPAEVEGALFAAIAAIGDTSAVPCDVFGDGMAGERIIDWLRWKFGCVTEEPAAFKPRRRSFRALVGGVTTAAM